MVAVSQTPFGQLQTDVHCDVHKPDASVSVALEQDAVVAVVPQVCGPLTSWLMLKFGLC
jgi:hypothetical protein